MSKPKSPPRKPIAGLIYARISYRRCKSRAKIVVCNSNRSSRRLTSRSTRSKRPGGPQAVCRSAFARLLLTMSSSDLRVAFGPYLAAKA